MLPPLPRRSDWRYSAHPSSRVSLPRYGSRVGLRIELFEACSAFTHVAACTLALPPFRGTLTRRLQPFRHLHDCSGCFRLERLPGGACTHWKAPPFHGARRERQFKAGVNSRLRGVADCRLRRPCYRVASKAVASACDAQRQRATRFSFRIAAWYLLIQGPERVTDREPNDAARRDSDEKYPVFQFEGKHGTTLLMISRFAMRQLACLGDNARTRPQKPTFVPNVANSRKPSATRAIGILKTIRPLTSCGSFGY